MKLPRWRRTSHANAADAALPAAPRGMRFLTKFNLLTIALIALTAVATTGVYLWQQWRDEDDDLRARGSTVLAMLAELAEYGLSTNNHAHIDAILESIGADGDIAYAVVLDATRRPIASRGIAEPFAAAPTALPATPQLPASGALASGTQANAGQRYLELIAPVGGTKTAIAMSRAEGGHPALRTALDASPKEPIGYVRLGLSYERARQQFSKHLAGALGVLGLLVVVTVGATVIFARRLVAPMHRLMDAAQAVGAGKLDVFVPPSSSDELGLLTHAFNQMTQKLAASQAEVGNYQRTLEDQVVQRTQELEAASAHAHKLAQHDILTGLPNRALLNQRLKQILAQSQRDGTHVACLFLDFDHFKRINDTFGHDAGDRLLQAIAQRLMVAVRETDTVARLGGDEFVVVLPGLDPAHATFETMAVLTRISDSFAVPFKLADQTPTLTCSIGVSMFPLDARDSVTLIKQADTAMYAAKEVGRNAYRFFTADMNARVQARLQLETDLRRAMRNGEFFLVYQPQIDMQTGRGRAAEALVRWRDPVRGVVLPSEFIPIAEESGMIQSLGAQVLRDACRQVADWHRQGIMLRLAVNLSVQQLEHDSCLETVEDALSASGLAPQYLELEITESVIITHPDKAVATLARLEERGVSITIDDFGTGYSSLSYLARLPIHTVKIDQRFVHGLAHNRNDVAITQAIVALSHSLGLRVVAEGVENLAQSEFLKGQGCEAAQGFLISRPLEAHEFVDWWKSHEAAVREALLQPDMWDAEIGSKRSAATARIER